MNHPFSFLNLTELRSHLGGFSSAARSCRPLIVLTWLSAPVFPLFCLLILDYMNYSGHLTLLIHHIEEFPGPVLFSILVIELLFLVLLLLFGRLTPAAVTLGLVSLICAYVNYTKVALNGDHFMPRDITMLSNAGELTSFLSGSLPKWFWVAAAAMVVWVAVYAVMGLRLPLHWGIRWVAAAIIVALSVYTSWDNTRASRFLSHFQMAFMDTALQSSNYNANGFVGAFVLNVMSLHIQAPEDYSQETIDAMLEGYEATPAQDGAEKFDVILILSESFFDARILDGVEFSVNPLSHYDALLENPRCYSGKIYTTAMGGGTVRPEFSILTGLTTDYLFDIATPYAPMDQDIPSYVSNYRDAGYHTVALHPYNKQFYSRNNGYPYLGFEEFLGLDEIEELVDVEYKRGYATDASTLQAIRTQADEAAQTGEPLFLFAITMQNHQPYDALPEDQIQVQVTSDKLSQESLTALTTYTQGLYDADAMLGALAEWIDSRERPTVLVFFGDHMPTLGSNYLAYNESGLFDSTNGMSHEELLTMYSTPFLIYANRDLPQGILTGRTGNAISDYNLLNALAVSTGIARTPYMNLLLDFYSLIPFYNNRLDFTLTGDIKVFTRAMEYITYDRIYGENYSAGLG